MSDAPPPETLATLAAGCFWCVEAVYVQIDGVLSAQSGFMGGHTENPTYEQICEGTSGHAEVVQLHFDPARVSYATLLDWFWKLHDPTTRNRQGADVGTQYRSAIFAHTPEQKATAEASRVAADASGVFANPIVTEIVDASAFTPADEQHDDYYRRNKNAGYCQIVISPKLAKLGLQT